MKPCGWIWVRHNAASPDVWVSAVDRSPNEVGGGIEIVWREKRSSMGENAENRKQLGLSQPGKETYHEEGPVIPEYRPTVAATNADFNKMAITKIAILASTGAARTISPYHTLGDGDSTFGISTNRLKSELDISVMGSLAAQVISEGVLRAAKAAESIEGWPAFREYDAGLSPLRPVGFCSCAFISTPVAIQTNSRTRDLCENMALVQSYRFCTTSTR